MAGRLQPAAPFDHSHQFGPDLVDRASVLGEGDPARRESLRCTVPRRQNRLVGVPHLLQRWGSRDQSQQCRDCLDRVATADGLG